MRDRSHRDLSGKKKYSATRWNYDRFMSPGSANFGTPYKIHLRFFQKIHQDPPGSPSLAPACTRSGRPSPAWPSPDAGNKLRRWFCKLCHHASAPCYQHGRTGRLCDNLSKLFEPMSSVQTTPRCSLLENMKIRFQQS